MAVLLEQTVASSTVLTNLRLKLTAPTPSHLIQTLNLESDILLMSSRKMADVAQKIELKTTSLCIPAPFRSRKQSLEPALQQAFAPLYELGTCAIEYSTGEL